MVRNDGDSAVSEIQLAADALNANRLVYLNAKADNKRLAISKDYKVTLDKVDFNPAIELAKSVIKLCRQFVIWVRKRATVHVQMCCFFRRPKMCQYI